MKAMLKKPNLSVWKKWHTVPVALCAVAACAWFDVAQYRAAQSDLATKMNSPIVQTARSAIEADMGRLSACYKLKTINPSTQATDYTPEGRACFIDAMPKIATATGALISSTYAQLWLNNHRDDEQFRAAALAAIAHGRDDLLHSKAFWYDSRDEVAKAHDQSIILRLLDGRQGATNYFNDTATLMNQAEFAVLLPDVNTKQARWLLKAHGGNELWATSIDVGSVLTTSRSQALAVVSPSQQR